ncbi:hypothetical protein [Pontibacter sp. G13]|uniref:hypothetical protein n=1 Tax=Pontibacter sp. G13 TaxID=3074898 RepID=UPI00288943B9|nr:hypothetical protein [Pontibacter sp. G13]WNJ17147.1 hypothetical protein RJD25_20010 [Pontibacter sp. G13]
MTDQDIKNSISEKALEYGTPSEYSELFDNLPGEFQRRFKESSSERNFGLPIVKYGHPNGNWIIIGTKELAWKNDKLNFLPINLINRISVPDQERMRAIEIQPNRMIRKYEYEILRINTLHGDHYDIWLNKVTEYYGFWHMMIRYFRLIREC